MPDFDLDWTHVVGAVLTFVGTLVGLWLKRRGERKQEDVQVVAHKLAERKQAFDELTELAERQDRELERQEQVIERLRGQLARERTDRAAERDAERASCDRQRDQLVQHLTALAGVVRSEVAQEAARAAIDDAARHDHEGGSS